MSISRILLGTAAAIVSIGLGGVLPVWAQDNPAFPAGRPEALQTTGVPGAPNATTTIDGRVLPNPPAPFAGRIDLNALQSTPSWAPRIVPPEGAPNILLIMTDDVGFSAPSTFGGVIPTPALDEIAQAGLRYTNFHSTALCSPTRAALITGKNHHSVGFGVVSEQSTGFPGYNSVIGPENATIGRILIENGYRTAWIGKNHNTPDFAQSPAGPFDQWPNGMGFEHYYGFQGGDTSQWQPNLFLNTTQIYPFQNNPKWNLITAMADDAIDWMNTLNDVNPKMPFFLYYVPGGTHAPHHPTPEWIDKIHAMHLFDGGWNSLRDTIFANQKRLGVIPQSADLTPWPDGLLKNWDQLGPDEKKLFIRQAEVYAAYLAYTDHEIGRVIQAVRDMGKFDNTLIIYISGDNGASAEGTPNGTPNEGLVFNGVELPVAEQMKFYDAWGTDKTYPHMAVPWAWAFDTPFKWTKQVASYFGGTRQGVAISWPKVITDKGGIRNQFAHVVDIVPTLLEVTGIPAPAVVDGVAQKPIEGTSLAYTFDKANADAPTRHHTQYFEMFGMRALWHDGWMLSTVPLNMPWNMASAAIADPATAFKWELFDINKDWTQDHDVAAQNPAKLREMQDRLWTELASHQVLPLDASVASRVVEARPGTTAGRTEFSFSGRRMVGLPRAAAPNVLNTSYVIKADIEVPAGGAEGMINTIGGRFGGYGMYLLKGKPVFVWNLLGLKEVRWEGPDVLAPGKHTIEFDFAYDGLGFATLAFNDTSGVGHGGTGTFKIDGAVVATQTMDRTIPLLLPIDESFDIGADTLTGVSADYQVPFDFTGTIDDLKITLDPPKLTAEQIAKLQAALQRSLQQVNQ
ncbi:arylsulfatase [Kaistia dalseonensis]|uniref:Arylsulfatase n=1 Tax=Kaistia dalseonensis TaxID=410840 RepID=A0ABU0HFK9_9HYPH|nr:arylsulfatase [Kaistia dalseonensis]MCX5497637.1 arylsulfatase [Kaistia dalseonensis]MDQ0440279.1 arylsulfatase [Kaistia dalseonensis]